MMEFNAENVRKLMKSSESNIDKIVDKGIERFETLVIEKAKCGLSNVVLYDYSLNEDYSIIVVLGLDINTHSDKKIRNKILQKFIDRLKKLGFFITVNENIGSTNKIYYISW